MRRADPQPHQRDAMAGLDGRFRHDPAEAPGGRIDLVARAGGENDREAVAGVAHEMVAPPRHRAQPLMHGGDDLAGGLVAEIVVEPGQLVDRGDEDRDRPLLREMFLQAQADLVDQGRAIAEIAAGVAQLLGPCGALEPQHAAGAGGAPVAASEPAAGILGPHLPAGEVDGVTGAVEHAFALILLARTEDRVVAARTAAGLDQCSEADAAEHGPVGQRAEDLGRVRPQISTSLWMSQL